MEDVEQLTRDLAQSQRITILPSDWGYEVNRVHNSHRKPKGYTRESELKGGKEMSLSCPNCGSTDLYRVESTTANSAENKVCWECYNCGFKFETA